MYCGIGAIPEGKRRGTASECKQKNQVRYYGIKEISKADLDNSEIAKLEKKIKKIKQELSILAVGSKNLLKTIETNDRVAKNKATPKQQIERGQKANKKLLRRLDTNNNKMKKLRNEGLTLRAQINNLK